jgi:hypothetical protein
VGGSDAHSSSPATNNKPTTPPPPCAASQGIALGLLVDTLFWSIYEALADYCTRKMNFQTLGGKKSALIRNKVRMTQPAITHPSPTVFNYYDVTTVTVASPQRARVIFN